MQCVMCAAYIRMWMSQVISVCNRLHIGCVVLCARIFARPMRCVGRNALRTRRPRARERHKQTTQDGHKQKSNDDDNDDYDDDHHYWRLRIPQNPSASLSLLAAHLSAQLQLTPSYWHIIIVIIVIICSAAV